MNSASKIIIMVLVIMAPALAQDYLNNQLLKAKEMFLGGEYFDAITEMKRLVFFDKENKYTYEANELIGKCYKEGAKFTDAIIYFAKAEQSAGSIEEIYNCRISIIRINILRRTNLRAAALLDALDKDPRFAG